MVCVEGATMNTRPSGAEKKQILAELPAGRLQTLLLRNPNRPYIKSETPQNPKHTVRFFGFFFLGP